MSLRLWPRRCACSISSPTARASSSRVPGGMDVDLGVLGVVAVGEQRLAEAAFIVGDEMRGGAEDMRGRAVVALQPDDGRARKILVEAQDVVDLGAAPAIDRLVVVADAADIYLLLIVSLTAVRRFARRGLRGGGAGRPTPGRASRPSAGRPATCRLRPLRQQPQPQILRGVGVLVLVDEDVSEAAVVVLQHIGILAEDADRMAQKVAEIAGVERLQPLLIGLVELAALAVAEAPRIALRNVLRGRAPCSSSRRSSWRTGAPASACRRGSRPGSAASQADESSVSRMVKSVFSPASSAWRRKSLTPIEWKVPSHGMPSTLPSPISMPMRCFISRAALLVKVTARICEG